MLARVFDRTKRFLSRSPSVPGRNSESRDTPPIDAAKVDDTMVTTRGGTETPGATATPRGSAKERGGKRELESLDTPTRVKRLKKTSPISEKRAGKKLLASEIPAEEALQESVEATPEPEVQKSVEDDSDTIHSVARSSNGLVPEGNLPIRRRSSPLVVIPKVSPPTTTEARKHTPTTPTLDLQRNVEGSATPKPQVTEMSMSTEKDDDFNTLEVSQTTTRLLNEVPSSTYDSTQDEMPASPEKQPEKEERFDTAEISQSTATLDEIPSSTYDSEQAPIASQEFISPSSPKLRDHVRFGSEEPTAPQVPVLPSPPRAAPQEDPIDDSASDSDEAPEVVTTATATRAAQSFQQTALRASAAQAAAQEAKRQAREARLAEERLQKRLRDEKKAKKLARQLAKQQKATSLPTDDDATSTILPTSTKDLPALLPDSLLASISAQRPPTPPPQRRGKTDEERRQEKLKHHIKFLERAEKPAKDVKKGKLSVAVLGPQKSVLPPKVNRDTRNVREQWLKGRTVEKKKGGKKNHVFGKVERRVHGSGGFLRGED